MPNRIIKESIRTSKTVNNMTDFQFRLWVYLITYVDDYGRGSADPELLKGFVFPRRKRASESDIEKALAELAGMGCIHLYKVDGESYFCFPNWSDHQRIQTKRSKFPEPPKTDTSQESTVGHGEPPSESESNPNPESKPESEGSAEAASGSTPVILLPLNDGTEYVVTEEQSQEWAGLYPAVDVIQQLRGMRGWLLSNPTKRKTKRGIQGFITRWLGREQDKGGGAVRRIDKRDPKSGYYGATGAPKVDDHDLDWMGRYLERAKEENSGQDEP